MAPDDETPTSIVLSADLFDRLSPLAPPPPERQISRNRKVHPLYTETVCGPKGDSDTQEPAEFFSLCGYYLG